MGNISKIFPLILILTIVISGIGLMTVKPAIAQMMPTTATPQFTIKFLNASYNETTTNSYTGQSQTQLISNNSIEITIKNQPLDYSNNNLVYQIYFDIRARPHFSNNWTELYPLENLSSSLNNGIFSYAQYIDDSLPQSNSSHTVVTLPVLPTNLYEASGYDIQTYYSGNENRYGGYGSFFTAIPYHGQLDFQVQALIGHNSTYWYIQHPLFPTYGGFYEPAIAFDSASGWSSTQTVSIGNNSISSSTSSTATPTPTPSVPEFSWLTILPILLAITIALAIVRKRLQRNV